MNKLLLLVGLIMVATACSSGESGSVNKKSENNPECNQSIIFTGYDKEGRSAFDICEAAFDETSQTLVLTLSSGKSFSYKTDEINPEYMKKVKNNKVTMLIGSGKEVPVIVEKDSPLTFETIEYDSRKFTFKSILKGDDASGVIPYRTLYLGLYIHGFSKVGNKILKEGHFFFFNKDFHTEITDINFPKHGVYSAAFGRINSPEDVMLTDRFRNQYNFKLCMARYEDGYLLIRIEDGKTYRYPIELFYIPELRDMILGKKFFAVSAVQTATENWIPVKLWSNGGGFYYNELIPSSDHYITIMRKELEMSAYREYMEISGVNQQLGFKLKSLFFEFEK